MKRIKKIDNKDRIKKAFVKTVQQVSDKNQEVLREERYWKGFEGRVTHRQNGEVVVGATRNIVDTSNLANSQQVSVEDLKAAISWDGNGQTNPIEVHEGIVRPQSGWIPGRPWVRVAIAEENWGEKFKENL